MNKKGLPLLAGMLLLGFSLAAVPASKKNEEALRQLAGSADTMLKKSDEPSGADSFIHKLEFREAKMVDVIRALADMSGLNIVATKDAGAREVTVFLQKITVKDALDTISKNSGLWYRQDKVSNTYRIMTTEEYQKDVVVYREDTTRVFNLLHPNPVIVATAIRDIYGDRVRLTLGIEDSFGAEGGANGTMGGSSTTTISTSTVSQSSRSRRLSTTRQTTISSSGGSGTGAESERIVSEKMTADQLARLEDALTKSGDGKGIPTDVLAGITRSEQPIYVTVNREHNLIIVRTSDIPVMKEVERLIKEMDRPTPQVLLEMRVLELSSGDSFRQAFSLAATSGDGKHSLGLGNFPSEGGTLVYQFINSVITAQLELLEKNNKVSTLSSPILLASNNKPARVEVGEERVIVTGVDVVAGVVTNGVVTPTYALPVTELRTIGNTLTILPKINADRTVTLNIFQEASTLNVGGGTIPVLLGTTPSTFTIDTVQKSNIQGIVVAKDGLTVAIGGLIRSTTSKDTQKVPFLGDIPVVGELFTRKEDINSKSELILLITPRIITNPSDAEDVSRSTVESLSTQMW